jgi:hypothetical protein
MSSETQTAIGEVGESGCWCCGRMTAEKALVRLGNHDICPGKGDGRNRPCS